MTGSLNLGNTMKILAVDDNSITLELLKMMAAQLGFTDVSTVTSGEIALNLINTRDVIFDCLLLDISMPSIDGVELCGLIRAVPAYSKTPIIMLTALTDIYNIDRAFLAGATDYATKPFNILELHARLHAAEAMVDRTKVVLKTVATQTDQTQSDVTDRQLSNLQEEVLIEGIDALIEYDALRNYLAQLSRAGLAGSQVIAVKIDHIENFYAKASADEFLYILTEVVLAIGNGMKENGHIMAYAGNGHFLVISSKAYMESSANMELEIQNCLDERDIEYDNGDPLDIEVSIGNPIRPSFDKWQQGRNTFSRAIARAESRAIGKQNGPRQPHISLVGKKRL
jgi:DNA-binding response OmpR family regulator